MCPHATDEKPVTGKYIETKNKSEKNMKIIRPSFFVRVFVCCPSFKEDEYKRTKDFGDGNIEKKKIVVEKVIR